MILQLTKKSFDATLDPTRPIWIVASSIEWFATETSEEGVTHTVIKMTQGMVAVEETPEKITEMLCLPVINSN